MRSHELAEVRNVLAIGQLAVEVALQALDDEDLDLARKELHAFLQRVSKFLKDYP